ncbi:5-oxoprolinase subunit PxpB [Paenalkalicoccus suaedae]|uniref:5-oxoprolinase subunit PxpB n=1 Tax=Paenalkalicoccus suaedae TaxID=2592382 RepID=A0A859FH33_9BACI|nr:5-oxoprolinase subunit PxpB [Paenalkalicoccus suaedae]QKS72429.1 5-oxoprolinase subunit PxpB [Paenalkalicoccus suaedae]
MRMQPLGDSAIRIEVGQTITMQTNRRIQDIYHLLKQRREFEEIVPTYTAVTVYYNPFSQTYDEIKRVIDMTLSTYKHARHIPHTRVHTIPVCYEETVAPDLLAVCETNKLTVEELINLHTKPVYFVYMLGFLPGFAYLGGLHKKLHTPRHSKPRSFIEAGSVGIAGGQTGIYPVTSPGGWNIIGRTPTSLLKSDEHPPVLLRAFDCIKFRSISLAQFEREVNSHD